MSNPSVGDAEPSLIEKLRVIAAARLALIGMGGVRWFTSLSQIADEAADALERSKDMRVVVHARHPVGYTVSQLICTSDAPDAPDFDAISGQFIPPCHKQARSSP
jgi:hypothetical protein